MTQVLSIILKAGLSIIVWIWEYLTSAEDWRN
jgi:hypothetical protein